MKRILAVGTAVFLAGGLTLAGASSAFADTTTEVPSSVSTATSPSPTTGSPVAGSSTGTNPSPTPAPSSSVPSSGQTGTPSGKGSSGNPSNPPVTTKPAPPTSAPTPPASKPTPPPVSKPPVFKPYTVTVNWYKSGGVVSTRDIWPQTLKQITCGGIEQKGDTYHITSLALDAQYKALIAKGQLNSPADDAAFSPSGYSVIQLPACVVPPTNVTVAPLVFVDNACGVPATVTIPAEPVGVDLLLNGTPAPAAGTYPLSPGTDTYSATAETGYALTAPYSGSFTVSAVPTCEATGLFVITKPTCTVPGVAAVTLENATEVGTLDETPGLHQATFTANAGYTFADGTTSETLSYQIPAQLDCTPVTPPVTPQPPVKPTIPTTVAFTPPVAPASTTVVAAPAPTKSQLAFTGSQDTAPLAFAAFGLMILGTAFYAVGRRRSRKN
jgi:hypothetical protein